MTPTTLVSREAIRDTPGADRTNSLQAITAFVPGAYMTHDQLHMRGGHQVTWLVDGVPGAEHEHRQQRRARSSIRRISTISRCSAAATRRSTAIARTASSTSFRVRGSSATARRRSWSAPETTGRPTIRSASAGTPTRFAYFAKRGTAIGAISGSRRRWRRWFTIARAAGAASLAHLQRDRANQLRLVSSARHDRYQIPTGPGRAGGVHRRRRARVGRVRQLSRGCGRSRRARC